MAWRTSLNQQGFDRPDWSVIMIYGEEKRLQMARSILPSSRAKSARDDKNYIKRRERSRARAICRQIRNDPEVWDDGADLGRYPDHEISMVVWDRRAADKLAHFERWAIEITKDIDEPDGRLSYMRAILPKGLIGDHAITHLEFYDEFDSNRVRRWWRFDPEERKARTEARRILQDKKERAALMACVEIPDLHSELNRRLLQTHQVTKWVTGYHPDRTWVEENSFGYIRPRIQVRPIYKEVGPTRPRLFRGMGDIDTFREDLWEAARRKPGIKGAWTERFVHPCRYFIRNKDEADAKKTYVVEYRRKHRPNPDVHPEWLKAFNGFVSDYWDYRHLRHDPLALVRSVQGLHHTLKKADFR